jgi:hypothetical protein
MTAIVLGSLGTGTDIFIAVAPTRWKEAVQQRSHHHSQELAHHFAPARQP